MEILKDNILEYFKLVCKLDLTNFNVKDYIYQIVDQGSIYCPLLFSAKCLDFVYKDPSDTQPIRDTCTYCKNLIKEYQDTPDKREYCDKLHPIYKFKSIINRYYLEYFESTIKRKVK